MKRSSFGRSIGLILLTIATAACLPQPFDSQRWKATDTVKATRGPMADRLIAQRRLVGLSKAEVVALLGPPTDTTYFSDWDLVYVLGMERGFFSIDHEWLVVRLNDRGRVSEARLVTD
jgi:hypothetical protein